MAVDLLLAALHHVLAFSLAAALAAEAALASTALGRREITLLGRIDAFYGACAMGIILVGIGRVTFGAKGWEFYVYSWSFWAKMAAFTAVGILSVAPTRIIAAWRRSGGDAARSISAGELARLRRYLKAEAIGIVLVIVFATAMARGIGY